MSASCHVPAEAASQYGAGTAIASRPQTESRTSETAGPWRSPAPAFSIKSNAAASWLLLTGVAALWVPAMLAASHVWGYSEYYDYGWFVPPAAVWLTIRHWKALDGPVTLPRRQMVLTSAAMLLPWILVLGWLSSADPAWRLPMALLGLTAAIASHGLLAASRGWWVSAGFVWITLLCLSALPWPTLMETRVVHHLTQGVVTAVAEVFRIIGTPVEVLGDRLRLRTLTVEVTDGWSGLRSLQSFVMATWFFAEFRGLRVPRALTLLVCACGIAFVVNTAWTYVLAEIRFTQGSEAFEQAHDALGLLAFGISGLMFYVLSGMLASHPHRIVVRAVQSH